MVPIRGGQLDSSSDAIGYVRGRPTHRPVDSGVKCCSAINQAWTISLNSRRIEIAVELFEQLLHASPQVIEDQVLRERRRRQTGRSVWLISPPFSVC